VVPLGTATKARRLQWLAAIEELKDDGLERLPVPSDFPQPEEHTAVSYVYRRSPTGRRRPRGAGPRARRRTATALPSTPAAAANRPMPPPTRPDARFYGTSDLPNTVERVAGKAQDVLERERHREHARE
jgi:Mn-containing catalase